MYGITAFTNMKCYPVDMIQALLTVAVCLIPVLVVNPCFAELNCKRCVQALVLALKAETCEAI